MFDHQTYLSPLTWRYGSEEMRRVWSQAHRRGLLRHVWVALAQAQQEAGLVAAEQVADLLARAGFGSVQVLGVHHAPGIPEDLVQRQVRAVLEHRGLRSRVGVDPAGKSAPPPPPGAPGSVVRLPTTLPFPPPPPAPPADERGVAASAAPPPAEATMDDPAPADGGTAPAVLNAIFAATGKRVRRFPLQHVDLSSA